VKRSVRWLVWSLCFGLIASGCATIEKPGRSVEKPGVPAAPPVSVFESLVAPHRKTAAGLEAAGDLRGALNAWKVALTIDPEDLLSLQGKKRVEDQISRTVSEELREGNDALKRGVHREARRRFLAALALDPGNKAAFESLQNEVREVRVISHTVRRGETLAAIAQFYYGDRSRSEVIWETNQLPPNPKLNPGLILKIPEIPGVPFVHVAEAPRDVPPAGASQAEAAKSEGWEEEGMAVNPMLAEAREALEREEFTLAIADVDRFLSQNPRNQEGIELKRTVLYQAGKTLLEQKKYAESFTALNQLVKLYPNYQDSPSMLTRVRTQLAQEHYNQGIRLYREEKLQAAIDQWRSVLQYDPAHGAAKKNIEQAERLLQGLKQRQQKK
jgi:tetratricopeptide (TPR) repeat protein